MYNSVLIDYANALFVNADMDNTLKVVLNLSL